MGYDCDKCPGYCCSSAFSEVDAMPDEVDVLAKHLSMTPERFAELFVIGGARALVKARIEDDEVLLARKPDPLLGGDCCIFFDTRARNCTVYAARPGTCQKFPYKKNCGYYDALEFTRDHSGDRSDLVLIRVTTKKFLPAEELHAIQVKPAKAGDVRSSQRPRPHRHLKKGSPEIHPPHEAPEKA